jgi:prepilin-type N-terminal cleavage/methylation domain-containing protein
MPTQTHATDSIMRTTTRARGFTLLEMLVVIGIIALLASLVLAVSGSVIRASEERSTRNSLELLNAATEEYERTMDRRLTYQSAANLGFPADPAATQTVRFDVNTLPGTIAGYPAWTTLARPYSSLSAPGLPHYSTRPFLRTAQLISLLTQSPSSAAIMQKIPDSVFRGVQPLNGAIPTAVRHVVDAWDTPIIAIFPGREANSNGIVDPATNVDADGTIKCDIPRKSSLLFSIKLISKLAEALLGRLNGLVGKPIVTSNQATLWSIFQKMRIDSRGLHGGLLLEKHGLI